MITTNRRNKPKPWESEKSQAKSSTSKISEPTEAPKDTIGEDGMTDYNIVDTVETFDVNGQQVSSFFVTPAIVKQIQRVPNYQSELAAGNVFGPCKVGQKKSAKTNANYWCLLFPGEEDY